jgi:hypothetical protein
MNSWAFGHPVYWGIIIGVVLAAIWFGTPYLFHPSNHNIASSVVGSVIFGTLMGVALGYGVARRAHNHKRRE